MGQDDWMWADGGREAVQRNGVMFAEVIDVLYAPDAVTRIIGRSMQLRAAVAGSGRPIIVVLTDDDRLGLWSVFSARVAEQEELGLLGEEQS